LSDHEGLPRAYQPHKSDIWQVVPSSTGYRLPSEAQWEYACRAGSKANYFFGDKFDDLPTFGWIGSSAGHRAHAVGELKENPFGLFDVYGNVTEWCNDWYDAGYYATSPSTDPEGPQSGTERVERGMGFNILPVFARSAHRGSTPPEQAAGVRGFRVVRNGPPVPAGK
jgi:formylglycine-generating enzyme required for sulfatase activity